MKCINCKCEISKDDNFCHECGMWTARGYMYYKDKKNLAEKSGNIVK